MIFADIRLPGRFHTRWYRVRRLQAASPRGGAARRRPRRPTPLDGSVVPVPYSPPSPECSLRSPSNCCMSATRYSGTGAQAASANSARNPAANACRNFIGSREMAGRRRIPILRRTSPGPTFGRAPCVVNPTEVVLFRRGGKIFAGNGAGPPPQDSTSCRAGARSGHPISGKGRAVPERRPVDPLSLADQSEGFVMTPQWHVG